MLRVLVILHLYVTFDISQKMRKTRNQTRTVESIILPKCSCMRYHHIHVYRIQCTCIKHEANVSADVQILYKHTHTHTFQKWRQFSTVPAYLEYFQYAAKVSFQLALYFEDCRSLLQVTHLAFEVLSVPMYTGEVCTHSCHSATALQREQCYHIIAVWN